MSNKTSKYFILFTVLLFTCSKSKGTTKDSSSLSKIDDNVNISILVYENIFESAKNGDLEDVKRHLLKGSAINSKDRFNRTPLHYASREGHVEVVDYLLSHKAKVEAEDNNGQTAVKFAVSYSGSAPIVKLLISKGASINGWGTWSLLHSAVQNGHVDLVKLLIENKLDVNAIDSQGLTPLHYAAHLGHIEKFGQIMKILLDNKADYNIADNTGKKLYEWAIENNRTKVIEILNSYGVK